jgi:hypothetical protein
MFGHKREAAVIEIDLKRFAYHPKGTLGVIDYSGERFYTIERPWLDNTVRISCIPEGVYSMGWRESPKFGETWQVQDVQNRTYILIHTANYAKEVQGCIGLGMGLMGDRVAVSSSRKAVAKFEEMTRDVEWRLNVLSAPFAALQS